MPANVTTGAADMQPGSSGQVLARDVMLPCLTGTCAEAFAIPPHEEINRIACARRAVRHVVLGHGNDSPENGPLL